MKKLLLLTSFFCVHALYPDALSDAIQDSDIEMVRMILSTGNFNSKNFSKYLCTADNIVILRRENIISQGIRPNYCENDANSRKYAHLGIALILSSPFVSMKSYISSRDFNRLLPYITLFTGAYSYTKGIHYAWEHLHKRHKDAIAINELLHDHFVEL